MDLARALRDAKPNETIQLPAGRYTGSFEVTTPVTLLARGQVVLDGAQSGPVLRVATDGVVRVMGCTIVGGVAAEAGGGVSLVSGELELVDCVLRFNKAPLYGGGALFIGGGSALVTRCRFEGNTGRQGGAVLVDGLGMARLEHCLIAQNAALDGGGLRVKEGARVDVFACTLADNRVVGDDGRGGAISVSGSTSRAPTVSLSHCIVSERAEGPAVIANAPAVPGALVLERCLLPTWSSGLGTECTYAPAAFVMDGAEPYLLAAESPAVAAGVATRFTAESRDVAGRPCVVEGKADLGAFAFSPGKPSSLPY